MIRNYVITIRSDQGTIRVRTAASSPEAATSQVLAYEMAPPRAVVNVEEVPR